MNSRDYWERRAAQDMYDRMGTAEETAAEMNAAIKQTSAYLEKEVKAVMRGMQSFGISEAEAKKILNAAKDGTALQRLRKAAQQVGDPEKREALLNAINSAGAYRYRITRIEELNRDIVKQCRELYKTENRHITSALRNVAEDSYYREIFSIQKGTGLGFSFSKFPRQDVDRILRSTWSGGNYSQRIWKDVNGMTARLKNELLVSMLSGRSNEKTARIFQEQFGVNAFCARRIVRTESAYVANAAQKSAYSEAGIERYRFVATLDSRTCECCAALDGKVFELSKAKPGTNYPPMHPFCRSTTIADFGDEELAGLERRAKDKDGNTVRVPAGMTYEDWHRKFVEGEPGRTYGSVKPDTDSARRNAMAAEMNKSQTSHVPQTVSAVSSFVPAKTVQEAQEYAGKFIEQRLGDKTFKGAADFKGISVEHANDINRALTDVFEQYDFPKISGIKSIDPNSAKGKKIFSSADAVMAYSPVEHGVYINKNVLKNPEALAAYNKQAQEAWNTVMKNMDSLTGAQREIAMRYKQAGRSLVGDGSAHDYFVHEMGHHIQWEAFDAKTNNAIGSRMSEYAGKISGYATASKSEYFAESFAAFKKGEFDKLDPEFVSFMRSKTLDKSGGSGIIKARQLAQKKTFNYRDFDEVVDEKSVSELKQYAAEKMGISHISGIDKLKNGRQAHELLSKVEELSEQYGKRFTRVSLFDYGDERTAAETVGNELRLNVQYLNRPGALQAVLDEWDEAGFIPKGCNSIHYIAKHEYSHLLTQDIIDEPHSKVVAAVKRAVKDGCETVSVNGDYDCHEFVADLLSAKTLTKSQKKLKDAIMKILK